MAKQRYINTKFWSDNFIVNLNPLDRYLFLYFLTNEHTNICGIYELSFKVMTRETGIEEEMLNTMLKRLDGKIFYIDGWVYIKNFSKHQACNEKVKIGIENSLKEIPVNIKEKIDIINNQNIGYDSLSIDYELSKLKSKSKSKSKSKLKIATIVAEKEPNEINLLLEEFRKDINPLINFANKTERGACEDLLKYRKLSEIIEVLNIYRENKDKPYCPKVTTPLKLKSKWVDLKSFYELNIK